MNMARKLLKCILLGFVTLFIITEASFTLSRNINGDVHQTKNSCADGLRKVKYNGNDYCMCGITENTIYSRNYSPPKCHSLDAIREDQECQNEWTLDLNTSQVQINCQNAKIEYLDIWNVDEARMGYWASYGAKKIFQISFEINDSVLKTKYRGNWNGLLVKVTLRCNKHSSCHLLKYTGARTYPLPNDIQKITNIYIQKVTKRKQSPVAPTQKTTQNSKDNKKLGAILGVVLGSLMAMLLIGFLIFLLVYKRRYRLQKSSSPSVALHQENQPLKESTEYAVPHVPKKKNTHLIEVMGGKIHHQHSTPPHYKDHTYFELEKSDQYDNNLEKVMLIEDEQNSDVRQKNDVVYEQPSKETVNDVCQTADIDYYSLPISETESPKPTVEYAQVNKSRTRDE